MAKITNKFGLSQALVDLVNESQYRPHEHSYSATTLLNPTRYILLSRRHFDDVEVDVNQMMNMVLGTAVHSLIEKFDKTGFAEVYMKREIYPNYYLSGKIDLYDEANNTLVDYKTASVYKITKQDFEDWRKQGLIYAYLLIADGHYVSKLKFHAILKDWSARELRKAKLHNEFYPEAQVYTWEYVVTTADLIEIENFVKDKFKELIECENMPDNYLPDCPKEDTWYTGDKFAIYKDEQSYKDEKKATKLCDTLEEAQGYIRMKMKNVGYIVERKGEYRKCQDYCTYCKFCKYYEERKVKDGEE